MAGVIEKAKAAVARVRGKNFERLDGGLRCAGWRTSSVPRARAALRRDAGPRHLLFAFCDHYEPLWSNTDPRARRAARARLARGLSGAGGAVPRRRRPPAAPQLLLPRRGVRARVSRRRSPRSRARGFGEVELHLHHDGDTAATLRRTIGEYLDALRRARPPVARSATAACATRSSTATGASPTRAATAAGAASTRSCRCCSRPAATPTSPSPRRPTSPSRTSSTRSTGPRATWRGGARYERASARASARCGAIAS